MSLSISKILCSVLRVTQRNERYGFCPEAYNSEGRSEVDGQVLNSKRSNTSIIKNRKIISSEGVRKGFELKGLDWTLKGGMDLGRQ